jgi:hypothetical protein
MGGAGVWAWPSLGLAIANPAARRPLLTKSRLLIIRYLIQEIFVPTMNRQDTKTPRNTKIPG